MHAIATMCARLKGRRMLVCTLRPVPEKQQTVLLQQCVPRCMNGVGSRPELQRCAAGRPSRSALYGDAVGAGQRQRPHSLLPLDGRRAVLRHLHTSRTTQSSSKRTQCVFGGR